jgi:plasmid stabilization system protein ParE
MRVRWTTDAADDLERICDYIAQSRPESARRIAQSIVERIRTLETFSHLGRPGRVTDLSRRGLTAVPAAFGRARHHMLGFGR